MADREGALCGTSDGDVEPGCRGHRWRCCGSTGLADCPGHLSGHREAHPETHPIGGRSASRVAGDFRHGIGHLVLLELLHVADGTHRGPGVDGLFNLLGKRHVDEHQLGHFQSELVVDLLANFLASALGDLGVIGSQVECRDARFGDKFAEGLDDQIAQQRVNSREVKLFLRPGHFLEQWLGVDDLQRVAAKGANPDRAKIGVSQWHRVGRSPLEVRGLAGADEEHVALERALEPVFPALQRTE